ncbi:hypothetical protein Q9S78_00960 [Microbacterium sp. KSW-18]|uniref:Lipoprotein n=1 Tax=Microbacterium aquilitoris TaxID=3067307 RepID=A0ABU3GEW2_9MICO|nr:hypothetical protein [Microbacterium sp. KSW-18]MDT3329226.1 hypothetical protein [Microbacterium sp. KSW-18]
MRALWGVATVLTAVCVTLLVGCAPVAEKSLGITVDDVAFVEYYEYPWGDVPDTIDRLTLDVPEVLSEFVRAYSDMPVTDASPSDLNDLAGGQTQSTRFVLTDGRTIEISKVWLGPKDAIVLWPDGTVSKTEWGSPELFDAYESVGTIDEVDAADRPGATLGR